MRVFVLFLSLIGAITMIEHALIPSRLAIIAGGEVRTIEQAGSIAVFVLWAIAAGLVYCYPSFAVWTFAVSGAIGLFTGLETDYRVLLVWGVLASGMALLTTFARREKRRSDRRNDDREHRLLAISLTMLRLDASVTELLATADQPELVELVVSAPTNRRRGEL